MHSLHFFCFVFFVGEAYVLCIYKLYIFCIFSYVRMYVHVQGSASNQHHARAKSFFLDHAQAICARCCLASPVCDFCIVKFRFVIFGTSKRKLWVLLLPKSGWMDVIEMEFHVNVHMTWLNPKVRTISTVFGSSDSGPRGPCQGSVRLLLVLVWTYESWSSHGPCARDLSQSRLQETAYIRVKSTATMIPARVCRLPVVSGFPSLLR